MNVRLKSLALAVTTALCFAGCGAGDSNANPAAGTAPGGLGNGFLSFNLDLGPVGANDRADILMVNAPDPANPISVGVNLDNNTTRITEPAALTSEGRDRPYAREQADLAAFQAGRLLPASPKIQGRFEDIAKGGTFNFNTGATTVTAQKMLAENQTLHCEVFAELVDGVPVIDEATALGYATAWDTNNPFRAGSGIYDQVRAAYGSEWNVNPLGGRDGNEKVVLLYLTNASAGGDGTFGFFRPADELTQAQVSSSNEGEILYLNAQVDTTFDVLATMAHEFQHMVRFNQKFIQQGTFAGQLEDSTINEGASVNAEEICGYGLDAPGGGNSFIFQTAQAFLNQAKGFNLFDGFNNAGRYYGGGYLLVKYFRETQGDAAFFQFNTNTGVGYDNMVAVSGLSRYELWRRFSLAMLASGFDGNVPPEARFPSGFTTNGTFNVLGLGTSTLPGLSPKRRSTGGADFNTAIIPYSVTLVRITGTGDDLMLTGALGGAAIFEAVLQSPPGTVTNSVEQDFGT